jgi:hypothetical protein
MKNKKATSRVVEEEITESITCDICKRTFAGDVWEKKFYTVLETQVSMKTGVSYPEGGSGEKLTFDICPTCFKEKLIPALKELGAQPTTSEWGW